MAALEGRHAVRKRDVTGEGFAQALRDPRPPAPDIDRQRGSTATSVRKILDRPAPAPGDAEIGDLNERDDRGSQATKLFSLRRVPVDRQSADEEIIAARHPAGHAQEVTGAARA